MCSGARNSWLLLKPEELIKSQSALLKVVAFFRVESHTSTARFDGRSYSSLGRTYSTSVSLLVRKYFALLLQVVLPMELVLLDITWHCRFASFKKILLMCFPLDENTKGCHWITSYIGWGRYCKIVACSNHHGGGCNICCTAWVKHKCS